MKLLSFIIILLFSAFKSLSAQDILSLNLQKNSYINIFGTTNINSFKLVFKGEKLTEENFIINITHNQDKIFLSQNELSVAVRDFTSGNKMALRDFLKLVKYNKYPFIQFQINFVEIVSNQERAYVNITITGVTKEYCIVVSASRDGDIYTITGRKTLSITDFGLIPPVEMMGLIKVCEWIDIDFHLICKLSVLN
jgi:hypothetical protein